MTYAEWLSRVRYKTKTTEATFPNAEIVASANDFLVMASAKINEEVDEDILMTPLTYDLVEGQREYPLPTDILISKIEHIELYLNDRWVVPDEIDIDAWRGVTDETMISQRFGMTRGSVGYDVHRGSIHIYCKEVLDVTGGLKVLVEGEMDPLTTDKLSRDTDMSIPPESGAESWRHGIRKELHELMCRYVTIDYKQNSDREIPLTERELKFEYDFMNAINSMKGLNKSRKTERNARNIMAEHKYGYDY